MQRLFLSILLLSSATLVQTGKLNRTKRNHKTYRQRKRIVPATIIRDTKCIPTLEAILDGNAHIINRTIQYRDTDQRVTFRAIQSAMQDQSNQIAMGSFLEGSDLPSDPQALHPLHRQSILEERKKAVGSLQERNYTKLSAALEQLNQLNEIWYGTDDE